MDYSALIHDNKGLAQDKGREVAELEPEPVSAPALTRKKAASRAKLPSVPAEPETAPVPTPPARKKPVPRPVPPSVSKPEATPVPAPAPAPVAKQKPIPRPPPAAKAASLSDAEDAPPKAAPVKRSERDKKPSPLAHKVDEQKVAEQKVKDRKAEKKAVKAAKVVVDETPEETEAFLRKMGALQDQSKPSLPTSNSAKAPVPPVPKPPAPTCGFPTWGDGFAHPSTSTLTTSKLYGLCRQFAFSRKSTSKSRQATAAPSRPTLQVPSPVHQISRETSPAASSIATGLDEDNPAPLSLGPFDFNALLKDMLPPFACEIPEPLELPGPLHQVELKPGALPDYSNLKGSDRKNAKRKHDKPSIELVRECDQAVVSLACNELEVLIYVVCAFPTESQIYALSVRANNIACAKCGRNYAIPQDSIYARILRSRIGPARNRVLQSASNHGLLDMLGVKSASTEEDLEEVKEQVAELIGGAMVYPIEDGVLQVEKPYQNDYLYRMLRGAFYSSPQSKGCKNPHSFEVVSIPLMALLATALAKALDAYSTGQFQKPIGNANTFCTSTYAPIFRGHLKMLKDKVEQNEGGLREYLKGMITRARYVGFLIIDLY
ncbi:unnamed protein product [Rhizoctonia solani]|uniref:DUF6532 domain-containing protein n=1 Tax=Rhizoctonia solani TaxID=456999 RepID=A0A8H3D3N2_9AGAM|nr:unnamed protein product [Rhizoctonia solani]